MPVYIKEEIMWSFRATNRVLPIKRQTTSHNTELYINDLMRHLGGVGVEYGTEWIIKHLIETELTPVNTEEAFEQYVEACYPDYVQVGWLSFDVCTILKELDPTTWSLAKAEFIDTEESEGNYISFDNGSSYYLVSDVEEFI